ncbi:phosphopantetheine-binding protein [Oribacterium sp. NK2B42]|uniref:phosphopantetheine-binding protein n=1 Tax=Oribacterium sp. NK2B42 TaxID=689781 RepID=UPI000425E5BC|nr:acyl carrier protein [Oribacterium sp. NK2B42]
MKSEEKISLLKQAWKEVFGVDEVADDADFFDDGGDSIKAVQLSSWLVQKGIKLDLGKIFYTPVLSDMAETLEETDAMYVPAELLTKDVMQQKLNEVMQESSSNQAADDQQICDPETMQQVNAADGQQICDPETMQQVNAADGQQICDPETMHQVNAADGQQICDPETMHQVNAADDQQICDPETMQRANTADGQQICDPQLEPRVYGGMTSLKMMRSMLKLMIMQQQTVLQMMEIMAEMIIPPVTKSPMGNMPGQYFVPNKWMGNNNPFMKQPSGDMKAKVQKAMEPYISRKADKPIEQPNVIEINKAKVAKPVKSAEEVLEHVLSGLLKNGFNKTDDLFEQGLTSLDAVKIVTRCGEHGYSVKMQDIYMHSTFDELVKYMTPGE